MPTPPAHEHQGGLAAAMSQAAAMLGVALSVEDAAAAAGQALVPCINAAQSCPSRWDPGDRSDGIEEACARGGLEAREIVAPPAPETPSGVDPGAQQRIASAKPFRLALETGGVVVGHNTWHDDDDQAALHDAFGVVSDVTDMGDIHGLVVGDDADMCIAWHGRNWVLHAAPAPIPCDVVGRHALARAAERIRAPRAGERLYGLVAMDYWAEHVTEVCGERRWECAARYAGVVVEASRRGAAQLNADRGASRASDAIADAAGRYTRIAELLWPLTLGYTDASESLLSEARVEISHAADALESAGEA